ncbi:MAG: methylmalonyl-CoA mutase family protein [Cyclobacteriaceae bacterium]
MAQSQFDTFNKADLKTWTDAAKKELGGKDPFDALSISKHNLIIKPYYDKEDTKGLNINNLKPSFNPYLGPRGWYNTPDITVKNCKDANKLALEYLNSGADGIQFTLETEAKLDQLLHQIELPYCSIFFVVKSEQSKLLGDFVQYVNAKDFDKAQIVGGIFWQTPVDIKSIPLKDLEGWDNFHALGTIVAQAQDPINEIIDGLLTGVAHIDSAGTNPTQLIPQLTFSYTIGTDFFMEIAKLKAFRRLWAQVCYAYGVTDKDGVLLLHGTSNPWNKDDFQPNANMLKSTTAALSAILGGCEAITIKPEEDNAFKNRIARNVLTVLREESHLNQTADAIAGSYYLESLIDQMAKTAWEKFQQKVSA